MTPTEQLIRQALDELDAAARSMKETGAKRDLLPLFARLDELAARLPRDANPDLLHYLQRKSYDKARRWLEGQKEGIARGQCGH